MAVSDDLPGVEVSIIQNGEPMLEREDDTIAEEEYTTTRYIEAESEQEFGVRLQVAKKSRYEGDALSCEIFIDGNRLRSPIIRANRFRDKDFVKDIVNVEAGNGLTRNFRFAGLETGQLLQKLGSDLSLTSAQPVMETCSMGRLIR